MSMLTRAGTMVRRHRRRYNCNMKGEPRRRSAPTVLQRTENRKLLTTREEQKARLSNASETTAATYSRTRIGGSQTSQKSVSFCVDVPQLELAPPPQRNGRLPCEVSHHKETPSYAKTQVHLVKVSRSYRKKKKCNNVL